MKRRDSSKESPNHTSSDNTVTSPSLNTTTGSPKQSNQHIQDEPVVSERAGYGDHDSDSQEEGRHVQFTKANGDSVPKASDIVDIPENDSYEEDFPQNEDHRKRKR